MTEPGSTPPSVPPGSMASSPWTTTPADPPRGDDRLASAFTRIADEQLAEQRAVAELLADLRARLGRIETFPGELDTAMARRISELAAAMQEALKRQGDPEDTRREADAARLEIGALVHEVQQIATGLAGLAPQIAELAPQLADLDPRLEGLEAQVSGLAPRLAGLEPRIEDIGPKIDALRPEIQAFGPAVDALGPAVDAIGTRIDAIGTRIEEVGSGVAGMAAGLETLGAQVDGLAPRLDDLAGRVGAVRPAVDGLGTQLSGLDTRFDGFGTRFDGLDTEVAGFGTRFDGLDTQVDGLGAQLGGFGTRFEGLDTGVTDLGDGLAGMRTDLRLLPEQVGGAVGGRLAETLESLREGIRATSGEIALLREQQAETAHGPALAALDGQLSGVATRLETLTSLHEELAALRAQVGELAPATGEETLSGLDAQVAGVGAGVAGLRGDLAALDERLEAISFRVSAPPPPSDSRLDELVGLNGRLAALAGMPGELAGLATLPAKVEELGAIQGQLADVAAVLIALQERFDERFDRTSGDDSRLDELAGLPGDLAVLTGRLDAIHALVSAEEQPDPRILELAAVVRDLHAAANTTGEDASLAPLGDLAVALSIVSTGVASLAESVSMLTIDVATVTQRLGEIDERIDAGSIETAGRLAEVAEATIRVADAPTGPSPVTAAELTDLTQPLTGEVASLRADFDNVRRLLLEELPSDDGIDAVALAADVSAPVSVSVTAAVTDAVRQLIREEISQALATAVDASILRAVEESVSGRVGPLVTAAVGAAIDRTAARQDQSEARLLSHVDEAVLALAEIVLAPAAVPVPRFSEPQASSVETVSSWAEPPVQAAAGGWEPDPGTPQGDEVAPGLAPEDPGAGYDDEDTTPPDGDARRRRFGRT